MMVMMVVVMIRSVMPGVMLPVMMVMMSGVVSMAQHPERIQKILERIPSAEKLPENVLRISEYEMREAERGSSEAEIFVIRAVRPSTSGEMSGRG